MDHSDLQQKLAGIHSHISSVAGVEDCDLRSDRYQLMASALEAVLCRNFAGAYCLKRTFYSWDYCHGGARLDQQRLTDPLPVTGFGTEESSDTVDRERLLFFDTETTGLGGAGVVPFLIGCGSYTAGGIEVRQYIIPDYSDEAAMLEALLEELIPSTVLVTYNGKAFDIPIVRDRMIVNRVAREIPASDHLDLLHATRRLFSRRLADCSLTNVERELFDFHRQDDIPGFLIPSVYFEWLGQQKLDLLHNVLEHNCLDIVSLAFLTEKIAGIFADHGHSLSSAQDLHSLARVYGRRRQTDRVNRLYRRIIDEGSGDLPADAVWFHSLALKRSGQMDEALRLWGTLAEGEGKESYLAHLELAKHYEHRLKQPRQALSQTLQADQKCPYGTAHHRRLEHRVQRLKQKAGLS
ncbi:MAG: ribonuclease H-like domain-containing protein [bacterium]